MGYDLNQVYEGRGPLEAASIGYEMAPEDMTIRCNIITLEGGKILTHNGGNLSTENGDILIKYLNEKLGDEQIRCCDGSRRSTNQVVYNTFYQLFTGRG